MKYRIKQIFSLGLAISMLLSLIPLYGAAMVDEFEGLEAVEEIPFEFVLEPGDLPRELLREAVLAPEDLPSCIDSELAEARGHVNRLYLQEPDDRTVMFQNRDGSKTVYLFSHPVKGMSASTVSSFEISGTRLSFTFSNAITSRVGVTLSNFNIGYAEIAYVPTGVLTEDGVNITEDVRDWARGESTVSALAYNISGEAAAEYAASVAVPETDVAATAAAAPGITITPNDPAPLGGMTVMAITYDDLAGVMSFKSVSANNYLVLHPNNRSSLMMYPRPISPYSRWVVSYDVTTGFTIANLYQPANKCLGFDDTDSFIIDSLSYMMDTFTLDIESSTDNIVTINCGQIAISSTAALYEKNEDDDYFPTSCQWEIVSKTNYAPVQSITTSRIRTVNAEEPFYEAYTTNPAEPTYSDINLHFASNNQVVPTDSDFDMDDLCAYVIAEPGMYQVYYKDVSSGVRSANFWLNVIQNVRGITPASSVRIEQSGVGFDLDYMVLPELANNYSISLYYASNDEEVDYEEDEDGEPDYYYIDTPGIYSVYYKDSVSGVTSVEFTMIITDEVSTIQENYTYTIAPKNAPGQYLTMELFYEEDSEGNRIYDYNAASNNIKVSPIALTNNYEEWDNISRTFVFKWTETTGYIVSATLTTNQYINGPNQIDYEKYDGTTYELTTLEDQNNALNCALNGTEYVISTKDHTDLTSRFSLYPVSVTVNGVTEIYYMIICGYSGGNVKVLEYDSTQDNGIKVSTLNFSNELQLWKINQAGKDVPLIRQNSRMSCGIATIMMYHYGYYGSLDSISGNTFLEKYNTIWDSMYINHSDGVDLESIKSYIENIHTNSTYTAYWSSSGHPSALNLELEKSGMAYARVITGNLPFYDYSTTHYVIVVGQLEDDDGNSYCIVMDCHYDNKYHGIYLLPKSQLWNNASGDWLNVVIADNEFFNK